jgi:hypothetical protein
MNWAWAQDAGRDKLLLLALADHAGEDGICYPGQAKLAEKCGVTERAIRGGLKRLEARHLFVREHRQRADGSRTSDLYYLALDGQPEESAGRGGQPEVARQSNRKPTSGHEPSVGTVSTTTNTLPSPDVVEEPPTFEVSVAQGQAPPHWRALAAVADAKDAKPLCAEKLAGIDYAYRDRDLTAEAEDFRHYWIEGRGQNRPLRDLGRAWGAGWLKTASPASARRWNGQAPRNHRGGGRDPVLDLIGEP